MPYTFIHSRECAIYPGEYIPLPEHQALLEACKVSGNNSAVLHVNMDEYQDSFKIDITVPGVKREDIFIQVQDNILSLVVLHKENEEMRKKLQIHEYDADFLERQLVLPKNADTEFISAEYRQGILTLYIPKAEDPSCKNLQQIVIY